MQFQKKYIPIKTSEGEEWVWARCAGGLAYHPTFGHEGYETITHVASGLALVMWTAPGTARAAIKAALVEGADWTQPYEFIKANKAVYRASLKMFRDMCGE